MRNPHGEFIWYELLTTDAVASARFYEAVLGWRSSSVESPGATYHLFGAGDRDVAGMLTLSADARACGASPAWMGYVGVDDVDAAVESVVQGGGEVHLPATDIPGVGRLAMLSDPEGATFYVMRGAVDEVSTSFAQSKIGHCHWNELRARDPEAALSFYRERFAWEKGEAFPMGELGDYQLIARGGESIGGVFRGPGEAPPAWTFYFGVEDIDAAVEVATSEGASVVSGPDEVPGGVFSALIADPQGATFGLVGDRR